MLSITLLIVILSVVKAITVMLSVGMQNVIMLSVLAPLAEVKKVNEANKIQFLSSDKSFSIKTYSLLFYHFFLTLPILLSVL
jgi:hypothetical protein